MKKTWQYSYLGVSYDVNVTYKRIRNVFFRLSKDGHSINISAPYLTSQQYLAAGVVKFLPSLLKKSIRPSPVVGEGFYLLGSLHPFSELLGGDLQIYLKKIGLAYIRERVSYFEGLMGIQVPYRVRIRTMSTRYGVNSQKTHTLTFTTALIHFSPAVIDSVVVHELSHHFVFDHSTRFYAVVLKYCPDYRLSHVKLRKGIYHE